MFYALRRPFRFSVDLRNFARVGAFFGVPLLVLRGRIARVASVRFLFRSWFYLGIKISRDRLAYLAFYSFPMDGDSFISRPFRAMSSLSVFGSIFGNVIKFRTGGCRVGMLLLFWGGRG